MTNSIFLFCFAAAKADMHRLLPAGVHIVEGVVLDVKASGRSSPSTIRINRAYGPEDDLVGREFTARTAGPHVIGNVARLVIPRLCVGELGLWVVQEFNGQLRYVDLYNFLRWPVREAGGWRDAPPIELARQFAEAVERVSKQPSAEDATAALKRLTTDTNPYISSWAITRLPAASQDAAGASRFLEGLAGDEHVPIQGQVALDRALLGQDDGSILVAHHNRQWQHSETRLKLFRRWFTGMLTKRDARLVVTRLDILTQHPDMKGFRQDDLLRLVKLLAANEKLPLPEREHAAIIMRSAAERYEEGDEKVFETAVELLSSDLPESVRAHIAGVLISRVASDDMRRGAVTKLLDSEKAESVAAVLKEALARPNGKPKRDFAPPGAPSYLKRREPFSPPSDDEPVK